MNNKTIFSIVVILMTVAFFVGILISENMMMGRIEKQLVFHGYSEEADGFYSKTTGMMCVLVDGVSENRSFNIKQHEICHALTENDRVHFCTDKKTPDAKKIGVPYD